MSSAVGHDRQYPRRALRSPAAPVAIAVAAGVTLDHVCPCELPTWWLSGLCATALWMAAFALRRPRASPIALLIACGLLGACWHHLRWSVAPPDRIGSVAAEEPQPIRVRGRLCERWTVFPKAERPAHASYPARERATATMQCAFLVSQDSRVATSGRVRLEVLGGIPPTQVGDEIEVVGRLSRPMGPRNPGAFDFASSLRAAGIQAQLFCDDPAGISVLHASQNTWTRIQDGLRDRCERALNEHMSARTAPIGVALLLGTRAGMSAELKNAFAVSGTTHILAISGANVAILAGLLWFGCRLLHISQRSSAVLVLAGILGYALLADAQPPVLRAVWMVAVMLLGLPWYRQGTSVNRMGIATLGVLAWNPAHLFDVGAQLSFLAVGALMWVAARQSVERPDESDDPIDREEPAESTTFSRSMRWLWSWTKTGYVATAAIWLFTLPLVLARFHLLSLIGFGINVVLAPLVIVILWSGYLLLICGLVAPPLVPVCAFAFEQSLACMLNVIEWSATIPGGHLYVPGPGDGWLAGFYACLGLVILAHHNVRWRHWGWRLMLLWTVAGLASSCVPSRNSGLRCTFLAVGHGGAVLLELPGGRTLLYDAGQLADGSRAQQVVQTALWDRGLSAVDAVIVSHADVDHFNGLAGLTQTVGVGSVFFHPSFLDFQQPAVVDLCQALGTRRIPMRFLWEDDRLKLDDAVTLRVLHPPVGTRSRQDNANSIVLSIEYAGRKILLTGDLEEAGLEHLLAGNPLDVDVLQAPHHGSVRANTPGLAQWAKPEWVVVSAGPRAATRRLDAIYGLDTHVLGTHDCGAVTFQIDADGTLTERQFLRQVHATRVSASR